MKLWLTPDGVPRLRYFIFHHVGLILTRSRRTSRPGVGGGADYVEKFALTEGKQFLEVGYNHAHPPTPPPSPTSSSSAIHHVFDKELCWAYVAVGAGGKRPAELLVGSTQAAVALSSVDY